MSSASSSRRPSRASLVAASRSRSSAWPEEREPRRRCAELVPAAGHISWAQVAVRAAARPPGAANGRADPVPSGLPAPRRPGRRRPPRREREAGLVPHQPARPAERPHRLGSGGERRAEADQEGDRDRPQRAHARAAKRRRVVLRTTGRGRRLRDGDTARPLLRHGQVPCRRRRSSARSPSRRAPTRS